MVQDVVYTREKHAAANTEARVPQMRPFMIDNDFSLRVRNREPVTVREMGRGPVEVRYPYAELHNYLRARSLQRREDAVETRD